STCAESIKVKEARCKHDNDCFNKTFSPKMNGRWTGRCLLSPKTNVINGTIKNTKTPTGLCEYAVLCFVFLTFKQYLTGRLALTYK
ncbi:unnamed protein product, partial [Rotaria sordida]